jgi:hypothetical protein
VEQVDAALSLCGPPSVDRILRLAIRVITYLEEHRILMSLRVSKDSMWTWVGALEGCQHASVHVVVQVVTCTWKRWPGRSRRRGDRLKNVIWLGLPKQAGVQASRLEAANCLLRVWETQSPNTILIVSGPPLTSTVYLAFGLRTPYQHQHYFQSFHLTTTYHETFSEGSASPTTAQLREEKGV